MTPNPKLTSQIAIVGAGDVGATIAYSLIMNPVAGDILMVDPKEEVRDAQVQDLSDATFHGNTSTRVRAGTHKEAGQCDIIVMTAGAKQKKGMFLHRTIAIAKSRANKPSGESRADLIGRNKSILESAINDMKPLRSDTILLLVANPVDALTYFAQKFADLPKNQVIGSGTFLDSARLRGILANKAEVAASSIDAYVLGEHGESQFVAWSLASIGGVPLDRAIPDSSKINKQQIADDTKNKATNIINNKGVTNYGIGAVAASICKSILFDQRNIRPVSHWNEKLGVCLSLPAVLGRAGVVRTVECPLSKEEEEKLEESAKALREMVADGE
jgi:L-lactate dehydrogenase